MELKILSAEEKVAAIDALPRGQANVKTAHEVEVEASLKALRAARLTALDEGKATVTIRDQKFHLERQRRLGANRDWYWTRVTIERSDGNCLTMPFTKALDRVFTMKPLEASP